MKILKKILKNYSSFVLFIIFIAALIIRWWYLPQKAIFFSFDQARDAFIVAEILSGDFKILGPSVSGIPGLFHGVLYYYLITPAYYFGQGNPVIVAYYLSFLNALVIFIVYYLTYLLTKRKEPAIVSALIYAFSFEASQYANLLTNASLAEFFMPLTFVGLYLWIYKSWKWASILTGLALGFTIQSELASAYIFIPVFLWLYVFRKNIYIKDVYFFVVSSLISLSSLLISEFKFGFQSISGLTYLFTNQDGITSLARLGDFITQFFNIIGETFSYTIFPLNNVFGGVLGILLIVYLLPKEKFLVSYILGFFIALPFGGWNMRHIMVGVTPAISILIGIFLYKFSLKNRALAVLFLLIILLSNIYKIFTENQKGQTIFSLDSGMMLSNEIEIIDYTYQNANGQPFSISTLTKPLYINTTWSYLYNWYGLKKYGYLPHWVGRDQINLLGNNLPKAGNDILKHYFISENPYDIPNLYVTYAYGDQDAMSKVISQKYFGDIKVEERIRKNVKK